MNAQPSVLLCVFGAIIVAASGNEGWGWLLFVAVLLSR
jgi:hypothetical protein